MDGAPRAAGLRGFPDQLLPVKRQRLVNLCHTRKMCDCFGVGIELRAIAGFKPSCVRKTLLNALNSSHRMSSSFERAMTGISRSASFTANALNPPVSL